MKQQKGYCDGPEGQLHWRMAEPAEVPAKPDLYCLSPAPFSSIAYADILPRLAHTRRVIAVDYPGQGGSDGDAECPTIESYAVSMLAAMKQLSNDTTVDVTGFHSGTLVAVETALQNAERIGEIVLVDVPAFDHETRVKYQSIIGAPFKPNDKLESLSKAWDMSVLNRKDAQPLDECLKLFADMVANGPRMNATFHAAFSYDVDAKFAALDRGMAIVATKSGLLDPSRRAAQLIKHSVLIERLDIQGSVLNARALSTAECVLKALDGATIS